ncbi:Y+L amino acid transporter 2-like isoform X1 [Panulirus ornatus]|uniref:Y+L amino acid transporter 2-like isoform X1 n=1 Tax=Panulirus ornatus TaxID=150431 RepID=UPI003A8AE801
MDKSTNSDDSSPPSRHLRPSSSSTSSFAAPTDGEDQGAQSVLDVADAENDRPAPAGNASSDVINQTSESQGNTSPETAGNDNPPVPPTRKKQNLSQRNKQGEEDETPKTECETQKEEKSDFESEKAADDKGSESGVRLKRELGLVDCIGVIVGIIIGSGIFVSPRAVLQYTGSVGMSLLVWVATGLMSMVGGLCYAELGMMIPQSGGNYTYLYEAFGPLPAFLYVWMLVMISIPSSRAIGSLTFAHYILQPFFPDCQEPPQAALTLVGILLIWLLTWINTKKVKWATTVQDVLAFTKVLALIMIIVVGLNHLVRGRSKNFDDPMAGTNWDPSLLATAFYHSIYAYDGWDNLNVVREELKDPCRNLPRAIAISITIVIVIYTLTNIAYFAVLSPDQMLASTAVAVTFGNLTLGFMAWIIPIFVACSTGGGLNGSIFTSSRLLFVSSRQGQLPSVLSLVHIENYTPVTALTFTATISMIMFVTSDVRLLINYISFAGNLVGLGCFGAFIWFRIKQPERHRPIKVWIGLPIIYCLISLFLTVFPVIHRPVEMLAALVIFATGLPVYYFAIHRHDKSQSLVNAIDKVTYVCQMLFLASPEKTD